MIPGNANPLLLASAAAGPSDTGRSLRFNDGDNAYLNRTPSSAVIAGRGLGRRG